MLYIESKKLQNMVNLYLEELEFEKPFANSDKFITNTHSKWACKELLRYIREAENAPFELTPLGTLQGFSEKMKRYAYMNTKNSLQFVIASEVAEYLIDEYYLRRGRR